MTEEQVLQLFKCLADRSRLRILQSLLQEDMYAERLAQRLGVTPATVSFHMKKLEENGLVTSRADQYYTMYTLRREGLTHSVLELIGSACDGRSEQERRDEAYRKKVIETFFEYGRLRAIPAEKGAHLPGRDRPGAGARKDLCRARTQSGSAAIS